MYVIRNEITTIDRYIFLQELLFVMSETVLYFYSLYEFLNFLLSCIIYGFRKGVKKKSAYTGCKDWKHETTLVLSDKFTISFQLVVFLRLQSVYGKQLIIVNSLHM